MNLLTTTVEHLYRAERLFVRPDSLPVTVELIASSDLNDGMFRVIETFPRSHRMQFMGRIVGDTLALETVARVMVTYGQRPDDIDGEFTRYDGPDKVVLRHHRGLSKLVIQTGPNGCNYALV